MTPNQFRAQHGDPSTWTVTDFDSFQVIAENTWRNRITFRMRRLTYPAYQALQAIHHISTNIVAAILGGALVALGSITDPSAGTAALVGVGLYLSLTWGVDCNEKVCPICRHNLRTSPPA